MGAIDKQRRHQLKVKRDKDLTSGLKKGEEVYIVGLDWHFDWLTREVEEVKQLWENGTHLADIAEKYAVTPVEVSVLIMDLAEKGQVEARPGGAVGNSM